MTQTLKVYVHHERDQVMGFTGSILGGDERMSGKIDVDIRYINENGRSRTFTREMWNPKNKSDKKGVVTFSHVPAHMNVVATADEATGSGNIMLLDPDELAAYADMEENGVMGGAFGDEGGFSPSVSLCPLQATDPSGQDHDECGSFAFVNTHSVSGLVWKRGVVKSGDDFAVKDPMFEAGIEVSLDPVPGKNLVNEAHSQETKAKDDDDTPRDDTHEFDFDGIAAGVYKLGLPNGWRARMGAKGATAAVGSALSPLDGDVKLDVTPTTATVYGRIIGSDGFPVDTATVTANGVSVKTDNEGRYIVEGIATQSRTIGTTTHTDKIFVQASRAGFDGSDLMILAFVANSVTENSFTLGGTAATATVSGTVTAFGTTTPVPGVEIRVDGNAPENKNAKSDSDPKPTKNDIYVAGSNGSYTVRVPAKATGATSRISAHKDGYTFSPAHVDLTTPEGSAVDNINFQGVANSTISGRVRAPDPDGDGPLTGGPLSGVKVEAMSGGSAADTDTTGVSGTYSLSVPAGTYTMVFSKAGYSFTCPGTPASCSVTIGLGQAVPFGDAKSAGGEADATLRALSLSSGALNPAFSSAVVKYTALVVESVDTITVSATATDPKADTVVIAPADADTVKAGHQVALAVGNTDITVTVTAEDKSTKKAYTVRVTRSDGHLAPSAPRNLTAMPGNTQVTLTWAAPAQIGSSAITGYEWEASANGQLARSSTAALDANATTVNVENLNNGATYTFRVYARNREGDTGRSPAASVTGKAQPAITLALHVNTLTEATPATDSIFATVSVEAASIEDITITVADSVVAADGRQVTITGGTIVIKAGKLVGSDTATIKAIDDDVDDNDANAWIKATSANATRAAPAEVSIIDDDTIPGQPRSLTVTGGDKKLSVEWVSPLLPGTSAITRYEYRSAEGSGPSAFINATTDVDIGGWKMVGGGAGARTVEIGSLKVGTEYAVQVRAVSAAGNGAIAEATDSTDAAAGT